MYNDLHSASMMQCQMMYDRGSRLYEAHGKTIITGHVTKCLANRMVSPSGNSHKGWTITSTVLNQFQRFTQIKKSKPEFNDTTVDIFWILNIPINQTLL